MRAFWLIGVAAYRELWRAYGATLLVLTLLSQGLVLFSNSELLAGVSLLLVSLCAFFGLPAVTAAGLSRWLNLKPLASSGPLAGDYKVATAYGLAGALFALPFAAVVSGVDALLLHNGHALINAPHYPCAPNERMELVRVVTTVVLPSLLALSWLGAAAGRVAPNAATAVGLAWCLILLVYGGEVVGAEEARALPLFHDLFPAAVGPAMLAQLLLALAVALPFRRPALALARR